MDKYIKRRMPWLNQPAMDNKHPIPGELRIFLNHIYELKKGIRSMVLYTMSKDYEEFAICRLKSQNIFYLKQEVNSKKINLFFGKKEYMDAISMFIDRPLNLLTPEEDFILGAMLGYDIGKQCKRFCGRKNSQKQLSV